MKEIRFTLLMDEKEAKELILLAAMMRRSRSDTIRVLISQKLEEMSKLEKEKKDE